MYYETDIYVIKTALDALWNRFIYIRKQIYIHNETNLRALQNRCICSKKQIYMYY